MDTIGKLSDSKTHTPERNSLGDQKMDNILYRVFQKAGPKVSIFYSEFFNSLSSDTLFAGDFSSLRLSVKVQNCKLQFSTVERYKS